MPEPVLRVEKSAGVVTLTLNRPQAMNALSRELRTALVDAFTALARDPEADVVIVTGAGRAFCAGLDLCAPTSGSSTTASRRPSPTACVSRPRARARTRTRSHRTRSRPGARRSRRAAASSHADAEPRGQCTRPSHTSRSMTGR